MSRGSGPSEECQPRDEVFAFASRAKRGRVVSMDVTTSHTHQIPTVTQPYVRTGAHGMPNNLMPFEGI